MTDLKPKLEAALGKSIAQICPNNFHGFRSNHCAHFVSHMVGLQFAYHCANYRGGFGEPANIRVQEIFAECPSVGRFAQADKTQTQLVFVTRKTNVNLAQKRMGNIPQKHIGVWCDGMIYHYSNSAHQVVKWTAEKFLNTFQDNYSGDQGLFYGTIPGSNLLLNIEESGHPVPRGLAFKLEKSDRDWFATALSGAHQERFYVGREVNQTAKTYHGIYVPSSRYYGRQYDPRDHELEIDHWAYLIDATAHCESRGFVNLINTYDRAKFTFGFYQLAAHTPDDNLILVFRELLALPVAADYFPELQLQDRRVHRISADGALSDLEKPFDGRLQFFMNFLNPVRRKIDPQEILHAARLIHWTEHDPACLATQVRIANEILQRKMATRYAKWYDLDGSDDTLCAIIADIHHHGRASKKTVRAALQNSDQETALLTVNDDRYGSRNRRLAAKIAAMKAAGTLGQKTYDAAQNEFVAK